jgi:acyl-coenzyme A synthetase/AMP-(fatty) acid ligase
MEKKNILYNIVNKPELKEKGRKKEINKPIHIIENPQQSAKDQDDIFIEILAANKQNTPFFVIDPYSTPELIRHIRQSLEKIELYDDVCSVFFTSGSTGPPKPIQWTNKGFIELGAAVVDLLGIQEGDRVASLFPLSMKGGIFYRFILPFYANAESIFLDRKRGYEYLVTQLRDQRINYFIATPYQWRQIANVLKRKKEKININGLYAGDRMDKETLDILSRYINGMTASYGSTEAMGTYALPELVFEKPHTVGKALSGSSIKVVNAKGEECAAGEEGEILMAGKFVSPSCSNPFYSGDLGTKDKDGNIFISGRKNDILKVKGYRINCSQLAAAYNKYNTYIFGLPSKAGWHDVVAVFETSDPEDVVRKYVNKTPPPISRFCRPKWVFTMEKFPTTITGKIDKYKIKKIFKEKIKEENYE